MSNSIEANDIQCSRVNHGQLFRVFFLHLFFLRFKEVDFPHIYVYEINPKGKYKKIAIFSSTTFLLKISFLTKLISLTPVQVNCIRLQYVNSRPFADKAEVLQSKPDS